MNLFRFSHSIGRRKPDANLDLTKERDGDIAMRLSARQSIIASILQIVIATNGLVLAFGASSPVMAQHRRIVINADQPNVWTMEQAHYLLAQMHRRDLDLRARKLEDLDANAINGLRFDLLRMLIEAGVSFNEASGFTNKLLKQNKQFDAERRTQLIADRDKLSQESLQLTRDISELQIQKAKATTDDEKAPLMAQIDAKTTLQAKVDKQIEQDDNQIKTLGDSSGNFTSTAPDVSFDKTKLPESVFDDAFKNAAKNLIDRFNQAPGLNATLQLENFLQMQYEIVSKQLTLLRDEVGPGERLLFLELPQTINASYDAKDRWAQSWWRIVGYTRDPTNYNFTAERSGQEKGEFKPTSKKVEELLLMLRKHGGEVTRDTNGPYVNLQGNPGTTISVVDRTGQRKVPIDERTVRTVELIPRQSSLNVNDMKLSNRAGVFSAVASFLFGFGARLNVQRQREQFSQFVQQELYSSAFGKGAREFGWTFTPMPGTDRLMSGVRTTYAAVIVPEQATSLLVEANGCDFPRSSSQPVDFSDTISPHWTDSNRQCGTSKAFLVPIPVTDSGENADFWVTGMVYQRVKKGQRIVVSIYGRNFSSQIGVLVDGSPLVQSIGLGQPLMRDDSDTATKTAEDLKNEKVRGRIERVDSEQIVFSFEMPPEFKGTPNITLISPGKVRSVNELSLYINGKPTTTLDDQPSMFGYEPPPPDFRIDQVEVFRHPSPGFLTIVVTGAGFSGTGAGNPSVVVNGIAVKDEYIRWDSDTLGRVTVPMKSDATIQVALTSRNAKPEKIETIQSGPVANTMLFSIADVKVINYTAATTTEPATLVVKITGTGFTNSMKSSLGELAVKSATEAILTIEKPKAATTVTLWDEQTRQSVKIVVTRAKNVANEQ